MSEATGTRPQIVLATVSFDDGEMILRLEDTDRTKIEFALDPIGTAMLSLTLTPALKLALAEIKAKKGESPEVGFPDTPEGL